MNYKIFYLEMIILKDQIQNNFIIFIYRITEANIIDLIKTNTINNLIF